MTMNRVRCGWSNFPGAPGLSTLFVGSGTTNMAPIKTFWDAVKDILPNGTTVATPNSGDQLLEATGTLSGTWSGSGGGNSTSVATAAPYSGSSGAVIEWQTSLIVAGRRVLGKTFIVPLVQTQYDSNGSLSTTCVNTLTNAGNALIVALAGELKVWSRPRPAMAGAAATVIGCRVPDLAVVMRSRRI